MATKATVAAAKLMKENMMKPNFITTTNNDAVPHMLFSHINEIYSGEATSVLADFPDQSIDLVVTDPPYLCGYKDRSKRTVTNDENADGVLPVYEHLYRVLKNNSYCISFYGWPALADFAKAWDAVGFKVVGQIVWPKPYVSKTNFMHYQHESAFLLAKGYPEKPTNPIDDIQPWEYTGNKVHPTEKAVSIITPLIQSFSKKGDVVLDPFLGSGTTAVAAALNDRQYIGIELEENYCAHARKRLEGVSRYLDERG